MPDEYFGLNDVTGFGRVRPSTTTNTPINPPIRSTETEAGDRAASGFTATSVGGSDASFQPNLLNNFAQVAYHIKFYTTGDGLKGGSREVIIAESGVTGFNIKDLQITGVVAPNANTRNTVNTGFRMTITEAGGTSFLDALFEASTALSWNWTQTEYWISVMFKGYDESGAPKENIAADYGNGGIWKWKISLTNIETHLDVTGMTYTLTGVLYSDKALADKVLAVQDSYVIEAKTVGEVFEQLAQKMNDTAKFKHGTDMYTYEFKFYPTPDGQDPAKFELTVPNDANINTFRNLSLSQGSRGTPKASITPGTRVTDLIENVLSVCEKAQKLICDSKGRIDPTKDLGDGSFRDSLIWRVYADVKFTDYWHSLNEYKRKITFVVKPFITQDTFLRGEETDRKNSSDALESVRANAGLKKKYEYIFTGLNTEVLEFDIKTNFTWTANLPRMEGYGYYTENTEVAAQYDAKARDQVKEFRRLKEQQAAELSQYRATASQAATMAAAVAQGVPVNERAMDRATDLMGSMQTSLNNRELQLSSIAKAQADAVRSRLVGQYAEDIDDREATEVVTPITMAQGGQSARQAAGTGLPAQWNRNKSIWGAVLDQVYEPISSSFMKITLTIRGDPFWLGMDYDKWLQPSKPDPVSKIADYTVADTCFALIFKYPYQVGETGEVRLRNQDIFNGVYRAINITHNFSGGAFKQTIEAQRHVKIHPSDVNKVGVGGTSAITKNSIQAAATTATTVGSGRFTE